MITTGFDARVKIQQIIENQLPEFLLSESPKTVDFLKQYYISQEYQGGAIDVAENLDQYLNLNNLTPEVITGITTLSSSVSSTDSTIYVESTKGFPDQYGLFKINNEIITYTGITTNSFTGCIRGFSGISSYRSQTNPEELVFESTSASTHSNKTRVHNLSALFLKEFYKKLKYLLAPGFEDVDFISTLDVNNFIKNIRSFYLSKGTNDSFRILYNVLYGVTPKVINLEDFLLKPSDAEFIRREILVTEVVSGDPSKLVGQMVSNVSNTAAGPVSEVEIITRNNKTFYKIQLFSGYDEKSLIQGNFKITPKSIVSDSVSIGSSVITVDSTIGFAESGTLISGSNTITYSSKSVNQFFGCSGVTSVIPPSSNIRSNDIIYGYENGDVTKKVELRVTGVLSDIENEDDFILLLDDDKISVKNFGEKILNDNRNDKQFSFNTWLYNTRSRYEIKSFNNNQITLFESPDKSSLKVNDTVDILDRNSENIIVENAIISSINATLVEIDKNITGVASNRRLSIRRKYNYASSLNVPLSASKILANVQNTYIEDDAYMYSASNSLPDYQLTIKLSTSNISLSPSSVLEDIFQNYNPLTDLYSVLSFNQDVPFITGDAVVYHGDDEVIPNLVFGRTYYVEVLEDSGRKNKIRLYNARSFISTQNFVEFGKYGESSNHSFTLLEHYNKVIEPKKSLLKFPLEPNVKSNSKELTRVGPIGKLINGVDIINYKSNDKIYYGPIDFLRIYNGGEDYDVINPPSVLVSGPVGVGTTALAQAVVSGSVKSIIVDPQNFTINRVLSATIVGGNGNGAELEPVLTQQYREIEFNANQTGLAGTGGIDIANETITFTEPHNLQSGEKIVYNPAGNQPLGISSFKFSNTDQEKYLINGSVYYPEVINTRSIYLYETESDYLSGINTVGFTTINTGGTHKFRLFESQNVISEIRVLNPGSGYENRKLNVKPTGISTAYDKVIFENHGFKNGDLINYSYESSPIVGLSSLSQYRIIKLDDSSFQLADAGIVGAATTDFDRKKFVKLESTGEGYQIFAYPPIQVIINAEYSGIGTIVATPQVRGEIVDVYLYEKGTNYGSTILNFHKDPAVTIRNGVGAELKPILKSGRIVAVEVQNGGKYYNAAPDLKVNGAGSGAKLRAVVQNGIIKDVIIINQGVNYEDKNTSISVIAPGKNAVIESSVRSLTVNNLNRFSNEILTEYGDNLSYGVVGYSTDREAISFSDPNPNTGHSKVIGWAIDGNPIYGPFGYTDPEDNNSRIVNLETGYESSVSNVYNRPSTSEFGLGFFIEDYKYTNKGHLDEHNGRFSKTPEYPNGVYAYYVGVTTVFPSGKLQPEFPYFIGNTFKSDPIFNEIDQSFDFNNSKLVRNTFPYRVNQENSGNDFILESNELSNQVTTVESVSEGNINSISIVNPGSNYRVGNLLSFENENTGGGGASAEVTKLKGYQINDIQTTYDVFENSVVEWEDKETLRIYTNRYHSLASEDNISISGVSTFINGLTDSHIIGISSNRTSLSESIPSNVGLVTDIYVASIDKLVGSGTTIGIGTEILSVLNRFDSDNVLRVKRGLTGTAHTSGIVVDYFADSFTIPLKSEYFDSRINKKIYFNPTESVGVGINTGTETTINYYVGNTPKTVSIPTQSIYLPDHQFKNNQRVLLTIPQSSSALSVSDTSGGSTFDLPLLGSSQYVYVINKSKDYIGLTTQVGLTSTSNGLFFTGNGSNNYEYSFETVYNQITAAAKRIKAKVSISTDHGLSDNDYIDLIVKPKLSIGVGSSDSIRLSYNIENKKILVNTVGFTSDRIDIATNQIYIKDHGYTSGEKVFYNCSDLVSSGLSTGGYYVYRVDSDNLKLAETYNDVFTNPPRIVSIGSTGGSGHELSLINPQLKINKNNNIVFDVSDSSLVDYNFKLYYDKEFTNEFVSTGSTNTFNIQKTIVGGSTTAVTVNYDNLLPTKLYYTFEKDGETVESDIDVKDYSEILYVDSSYNGQYKIFGIGSTSFNISLEEVPERTQYTSANCDAIEYSTSSLSASGPIDKINIISGGFNYKILPRIVGLTTGSSTSVGSNAILRANTLNIGNLNEYRIINEGFEYPADKTLRPQADIPTLLSLEGSQKINRVDVINGGKNYISAPSLVVVNLYNRTLVNSGLLVANFKGNTIISVDVVEEPKGLDNVTHRIFAINNSNGIQVERVLSYSGGIVECELSTPPIDGFVSAPFNVGDRVFVEGILKQSFTDDLGNITSPGTGFNSSDNGYNFFEVVEYTNSNPAILKYNIGEYTENAGTPVTNQSGFTSIVKNQNYPVFSSNKVPSIFFEGESLYVNNSPTNLLVKVVRENFIKITGDYDIKIGDRIKGTNSGNFATINNINKYDNRFNISYSNKKEFDWKDDSGKLNLNLQVLPDNDYYQNLSYTIKSPIEYEKAIDKVNNLVHPSGMKNFADTEITSKSNVSIASSISLLPVLDFISERRVDTISNFDLVLDYDPTATSSRFITFKNKRLSDYVECRTNRVLQIDDISGRFSSSEFNKNTFTDTIEYPITDFYSKFLVQVMDEDKQSVQVSELVVLNNYNNTYTLNKIDLFTDQRLGDFSGTFGDVGDPILRFIPTNPNDFNYNLKIYRESFSDETFSIGIGFTEIGFTRLSSKTETVGPSSGSGLLGVSTAVFNAQASLYDTIYAFAHVLDTETNEANYFEVAGYYDGQDTYLSEFYFDTNNTNISAGFIGTFGLNVNSGVISLSFKNENSNNNVRVKVKTVGIGSTTAGVGTFRYLVDGQIPGTERTARFDSQYQITSGISTVLTFDSVLDSSLKSIVKVSAGSTVAVHNLLIVSDQTRTNIQQSPFISVGSGTGIGTFGTEMSGTDVIVKFYPDSEYTSDNIVVQLFNQFIYSDIDEFNIPDDFVYGNSIENITNAFYGSINEFGKDKLDFDLNYQRIPIFEKTFNPSNTAALNRETGVFSIDNHFFETGEELIYTPDSTLIGINPQPMGIGETIVSGVTFTADFIAGFSTVTGIAVSTGISTESLIFGPSIPSSTTEIIGIGTNYTFFVGQVVSGGSTVITGVGNTSILTVGAGIFSGDNTGLGTITSIGINSITSTEVIPEGSNRIYYSTDENFAITLDGVSVGSTFRKTYSTGITTDICPTTVYAIRISKDQFKISGTSGGSGVGFTFTSIGSGNRHKLEMKKKLEKSLITIDGVTQYPLMYTPLTYTLKYNNPVIGAGVTFLGLSGISSIRPRDILRIDNEYLNIKNVGLGTTASGPITGIGTVPIIEVSRGFVGSSATTHSDESVARIYKGAYNIVGNKIHFTEAPDGKGNNDRLNSSNLSLPKSSFNGRVYLRKDYTNNKIYDDISLDFNGIGQTFTVYREGQNTTGLEAGSNLLFINDIFQTPDTINNVGNNYEFSETAATGISSVTFTGINRPNTNDKIIVDYDVNQNQLPRGGVVLSVAQTGGLGYAPLIGAKLRAEVTGGVITNVVGVPTYGQSFQISTSTYNHNTGILEVTTSTNHPFDASEDDVYLENLEFSCDSAHAGVTTTIFPDGTLGNVFPVVGVVSATTFNVNIGVSTIPHTYVGQGTAYPYYSKLNFGSGYNTTVSIGVSDSTGSGADITAVVGAGGSLALTINNGGSGYTEPVFEINDPSYENLSVIGVSRLGIGNTTQTGIGLSMTIEIGPSYAATGIGSTCFEVRSYEITKPGYSFRVGDVFKVVGLVTDGRFASPIRELQFTVTDIFADSFASWQLGEFDFIDSISNLQNGERTRFPLFKNNQLLSFQKNNSNVDSSLIDLDAILLIYVNGVMQEPGISYEFTGGTTFTFKEAPKASDNVDIFFYRGTRDIDSIEVNVNETIKPGDSLKINKNPNLTQTIDQDSRIVSEITASDLVQTGIYLGDGIDDTNYKPVDWSKQKRDLLLNDNAQTKVRDSLEGLVFPTSKIIKDFSSTDVEIFLDSAQFFNYEENESDISIRDFSGLLVQGGNDPVSAAFTANVSIAGTISSVTVLDGGSGYIPNSVLDLKIGKPIGGIGTVFKFDVKRRGGFLGIGSDVIIGIDTSSIRIGQTLKSIPNVIDTTTTVIGIDSGSNGKVELSKSASNTIGLSRSFDFGKYQDQSVAIGSAFVSSAGIVTLTTISTPGAGYTSTYSPEVTISTPNLLSEVIGGIQFVQGFSGIITGITTSTGTSGNPLALTFHVLYDSSSDIDSLSQNYPIYVFDTTVGQGVTSIDNSDSATVGIGSTFVDNIYYVHSISRDNLTGIITSNILSTTNITGIHTMPNLISGRFSWGKLSGFERTTSSIGVAVSGYTVNSGLTTFPTIQRRGFGLRDLGALRKDLG